MCVKVLIFWDSTVFILADCPVATNSKDMDSENPTHILAFFSKASLSGPDVLDPHRLGTSGEGHL